MSADSYQVIRVLDRCLDTAESDSDTTPDVAAAAARAKADPDMHAAISVLLAEEPGTTTCVECCGRFLAFVRQAEPGDSLRSFDELCDNTGHVRQVFSSRQAASGVGGERCDEASPIRQVFSSCQAASGVAGEPDAEVAVTLTQLFLAAIMVERSSLGDARSRRLRNAAAHGAVAAAVYSWRNLAAHKPETRRRRRPR